MTAPLLTYRGGRASDDVVRVKLETLYETRMLLQGSSGAGKTQACFHLLEETHGHVQQIVLDREGEFGKLREQFDYLILGADGEKRIPLRKGALELQLHRVLELQISAIYDLSDLVPAQQQHVVARLASAMAHLPRGSGLWDRMRLVLIDEAQWFAPQSGKAESLEALIELASLGRKRGFCPIAAGTRVAMINKSFTELLENKLIGRAGTNDSKRAAEELEFDKHGRRELRSLAVGHFYAYGPAIALDPVLVQTPKELPVLPRRRGEHRAPTPAPPAKVQRALAKFEGLEEEAEKKERTLEDLQQELAGAKRQLQQLQKGTTEGPAVIDERATQRAVQEATRQLSATIAQLRRALEAAVKFIIQVNTQSFDAAGVDKAELERAITAAVAKATQLIDQRLESRAKQMDQLRLQAQRVAAQLKSALGDEETVITVDVAKNAPFTVTTPVTRREPQARTSRASAPSADGVSPSMQKVLDAAAALERLGIHPAKRINVAFFAGYTENGHFNNMVGELRTKGLLDYPVGGMLELTEAGRAAASADDHPITSLDDLHNLWLSKISPSEAKLLSVLIANYPTPLSRAELAAATGYTENGHFNNMVGHLSTLGAVHYPTRGAVAASDVLFPEGLR